MMALSAQETAINVGFSSRLINGNMDLIKINTSSLVSEVCSIFIRQYIYEKGMVSPHSNQDSLNKDLPC